MFPRISETFILNEIRALRRAEVPFRIYSILTPTRDERTHPEAEPFVAETSILPQPAWREMPELKAVRNQRVHGVGEDYVPHASQRIVQTAELFARLIHPEAR